MKSYHHMVSLAVLSLHHPEVLVDALQQQVQAAEQLLSKPLPSMTAVPRETGAACMDGSQYGFYMFPGNPKVWTIYMNGGGWCSNKELCTIKSATNIGSSKLFEAINNKCQCMQYDAAGVQQDCTCVHLPYCDGSSFAGFVPGTVQGSDGTTRLHLRGRKNFNASFEMLLEKYGLSEADELIIAGSSAGGLATVLHADAVAARMPANAKVRGVSDCGYFLDHEAIDHKVANSYGNKMKELYSYQKIGDGLSQKCLSENKNEPWNCFLVEHALKYVKTPIFFINSRFDSYQLESNFKVGCFKEGPHCTEEQVDAIEEFGKDFLRKMEYVINGKTRHGAWLTSCVCHACPKSLRVNDVTAYAALGRWYTGATAALESVYVDEGAAAASRVMDSECPALTKKLAPPLKGYIVSA